MYQVTIFIMLSTVLASAAWQVGPYLQNVSTSGAWVVWEDTKSSAKPLSWVNESDPTDTGSVRPKTLPVHRRAPGNYYVHQAQLTQLKPGSRYQYQMQINGTQQKHSFRTAPDKPGTFRFAVYSDTQWNPHIHRHLVNDTLPRLLGGKELSFVLVPGDLVHVGSKYREYRTKFFDPIQSLSPSVPYYPALGNHEYQGLPKGEAPVYLNYFKTPENGEAAYRGHWYHVDYSNVRIISLNTNLGATVKFKHHPDMYDDFGKKHQFQWLEKTLKNFCESKTLDFVYVYFHHPSVAELWTIGGEPYSQEIIDRVGKSLSSCGKAGAIFNGHMHAYARGQSKDHPLYWVTVASAGGRLDHWGEYKNKDYPSIQMSFPSFGLVMVEVTPNRFDIKRFGLGTNPKSLKAPKLEDHFYFDKNDPAPKRPSILTVREDGVLASDFEDAGDRHLESEWVIFDLLKKAPVFSSWVRFENQYLGKKTFSNMTRLKIPNQLNFDPKRHEVQLRYRDQGLKWSPWSHSH